MPKPERRLVHYIRTSSRVLTKARDFYTNTLCDCGRGVHKQLSSVINSTVPQESTQLQKNHNVGTSKEIDGSAEDLQGLMRLLSTRKGGGAKVVVDSKGNLVWRKPVAETSYSGGVGRLGRIDEDKPCSFNEVDVNKFTYTRSRCRSTNRRNIVAC